MRVIQKGDIVVISKTVDLSKYPHLDAEWTSLRASHFGRQGKVVKVDRTLKGNSIVYVRLLENTPDLKVLGFYWFTGDVSLLPGAKWRRQAIGEGNENWG